MANYFSRIARRYQSWKEKNHRFLILRINKIIIWSIAKYLKSIAKMRNQVKSQHRSTKLFHKRRNQINKIRFLCVLRLQNKNRFIWRLVVKRWLFKTKSAFSWQSKIQRPLSNRLKNKTRSKCSSSIKPVSHTTLNHHLAQSIALRKFCYVWE